MSTAPDEPLKVEEIVKSVVINMGVRRKILRILIPFMLIIPLTMFVIAWMHTLLDKSPNHRAYKPQSIPADMKMLSIVQENSPKKQPLSESKKNLVRTKGPILSLEYMHKLLDGSCGEENYSKSDEIIPDKNSWIPRKMCKNCMGPYYIKLENGKEVPYTNYTFMPLTLHSKYLLNNPNICENVLQNLTFLILVHSAVQHFHKRKALRETWANPLLLKEHTSRLVFIVGRTEFFFVQRHLEDENNVHKDIVQGDFIDDYHNLTHKAVLGHRWIQEHCQNTKFILKVDDDVMVNIFKVIEELLPAISNSSNMIACRVRQNVPVGRNDRWAVSYDYFPGYQNFPFELCPGAFALMPLQTSLMLFLAAQVTPFLWLDDVYVYGILVRIANIRLRHTSTLYNEERDATQCFKEKTPCPILLAFTSKPEIMSFYWRKIADQYKDIIIKYAYMDQIAILDEKG